MPAPNHRPTSRKLPTEKKAEPAKPLHAFSKTALPHLKTPSCPPPPIPLTGQDWQQVMKLQTSSSIEQSIKVVLVWANTVDRLFARETVTLGSSSWIIWEMVREGRTLNDNLPLVLGRMYALTASQSEWREEGL